MEHIFALNLYNDNVVRPTLLMLSDRIDSLEHSKEPGADHLPEDYATMAYLPMEPLKTARPALRPSMLYVKQGLLELSAIPRFLRAATGKGERLAYA